jgi:hypothetical protein
MMTGLVGVSCPMVSNKKIKISFSHKGYVPVNVHPFGRAKPHLLRRGRKARLRVNLEQASRIHAGGVERFTNPSGRKEKE